MEGILKQISTIGITSNVEIGWYGMFAILSASGSVRVNKITSYSLKLIKTSTFLFLFLHHDFVRFSKYKAKPNVRDMQKTETVTGIGSNKDRQT